MTPPPISPVPATEARRDECSCAAWRVNVPRLNAPFILAAGRNPGTYKGYDGDPLRYCPWCGTWLGSPPAVVESSEGLEWQPEDADNLRQLRIMCFDLKARLVPFGASADGWESAIATLARATRAAAP